MNYIFLKYLVLDMKIMLNLNQIITKKINKSGSNYNGKNKLHQLNKEKPK